MAGSTRRWIAGFVALLSGFGISRPVRAQTVADSAEIVLDAARGLERQGQVDAARQVFRYLVRRYPATPAALTADSLLRHLGVSRTAGHTGLILFHTLYGGFLGVAVPAALGADGAEPYGAGLLIGGPLGFFGSRAFARRYVTSAGQAGIASFAAAWGTWQGLGWQQALNLGQRSDCFGDVCYVGSSDTAPWAAMTIGGLIGVGTGFALAATRDVRPGTSTLISHAALWGTWFGTAISRAAGVTGDNLWAVALTAGNVALLGSIPAASAWKPSSTRVRLTTAAGVAGGLAGLGIDLIADLDDIETALLIPAAGSAIGLLAGVLATKDRDDADGDGGFGMALLTIKDTPRLNLPALLPTMIPVDAQGKRQWRPGIQMTLLNAEF